VNDLSAAATHVVHWRHSLRTRLMGWFGALLALVLVAGFAVAYYVARQQLLAEAEDRTRFEARQAAERVAATMASVRITSDGVVGLFNRLGLQRNDLVGAMEALVAADGSAAGGLVALEPGVLVDGQPLAYYAGRDAFGVPDRDMLADGYDLFAQGWYQRTLQAPAPWWSEPYFNETAGGVWMVTLNRPLRDAQGVARGMVSLDVPVRRLGELLDPVRQIPGHRVMLFAPGGTIALHPEPGVALNNTLAGFAESAGRTDLAPMETARAAGQPLEFRHRPPAGGSERFTVYTPIADSGWGLQISLEYDVVLADLQRQVRWLGLGALLAVLVMALVVRRLAARITVPLSELTGSAGHFAIGEYDWPVPHDTRGDEVGVMARALERARDSIRFQLDEIAGMASERQKLESELDIARDIQLAMLPAPRQVSAAGARVEAGALLKAAKAVGGDFYNFFDQGDGVLWFVAGDVSDKGVPAALFMARTMTVLEVAAQLGGSPARALAEASRHLVEGNDTCMFATALCGKLDLATGELAMANAGHEPPVLLRADGRREWLAVPPGGPLGFEAQDEYALWTGRLGHGDTLVLYTDGVTEAFDPANLAFGEQRLLDALAPGREAQGQCEALLVAVQAFAAGAPQSDDITVLALRYLRDDGTEGEE
jgi:sigma-B regulation protein RsbU (phosphoserine phosphatase)